MNGSDGLWQIVLGWVPTVVWAGVVVTALILLRTPLRQLLPRLEKVTVAGVDVSFVADDLSAAAAKKKLTLSQADIQGVAQRAGRNSEVLRGARVVWLDPRLENIQQEMEAFRALGMHVVRAEDVDGAVKAAAENPDVVITNWGANPVGPSNALDLVEGLRRQGLRLPVIVYTTGIDEDYQETPAGIFAETARPDRLLHFVIDALEHAAHEPYRQR